MTTLTKEEMLARDERERIARIENYRKISTHEKCIEQMIEMFTQDGIHTFKVTFSDAPGTGKVRTFMAGGMLYFFKGRATRRGYYIGSYPRIEGGFFATVEGVAPPPAIEQYCSNLNKFKRAFTTRCHRNLWKNIQDAYVALDVEDFRKFATPLMDGKHENSKYGGYKSLWEYRTEKDTDDALEGIIMENSYKTTTIRSNRPRYSWKNRSHTTGDYNTCQENIQRHLDNKEDFRYSWRSNYDVTAEGRLGDDGVYRAWLSLEYYDCANGYYYALINENSAVFLEKD